MGVQPSEERERRSGTFRFPMRCCGHWWSIGEYLGVPGDYPRPGEETPLLLSIKGTKGVGENQIYRSTKRLFARAHDYLEARLVSVPSSSESSEMASDVQGLKYASAHWLRHTYATDLVDAGLSIRLVRENMGHTSLDSTSGYDHSTDSERHEETKGRL